MRGERKKNDGRAQMYARTREILEDAITLDPADKPEKRKKLEVAKAALLQTRDNQISAAARAAHTAGAMNRAVARIEELYKVELTRIEELIKELE